MAGQYARKFIVTDDDKRYAADLARKIERAQCQMTDLLKESFESGAYIAAGFTTWPAFAFSVLDQKQYRVYDIARAMGAATGDSRIMGQTPKALEVEAFIRDHPGVTIADVNASFGADKTELIRYLKNTGAIRYDRSRKAATLWPVDESNAG